MRKVKDLIGMKFGKWIVIDYAEKPETVKSGGVYWLCECDCGTRKIVAGENLKGGQSRSCGCFLIVDISNQKFSRVTALYIDGKNDNGQIIWHCICDCGREFSTLGQSLRSGSTKSCGCLCQEKRKERHLEYGESYINELHSSYVNNAKKRGHCFEISKYEFCEIISQNCYYCGKEPEYKERKGRLYGGIQHNGIDRINNNAGYTVNNCVPCCSKCNHSKANYSYDEFLLLVKIFMKI